MSEQTDIKKVMSILGKRTSEAKRAASQINGKKGGRPKLKKTVDKPSR